MLCPGFDVDYSCMVMYSLGTYTSVMSEKSSLYLT